MSQTGKQLKLQEKIKNASTRLDKFKENPQTKKLDDFQSEINDLIKAYDALVSELKKNKELNQGDVDEKIKKYSKKKKDIVELYQILKGRALGKETEQLMIYNAYKEAGGNNMLAVQNRKLAMELRERVGGIQKQTGQVKQVITNVNTALAQQENDLDEIDRHVDDIETDLSVIDQFMRVINNRHLLTKLMLVLLILFLGVADFLILVIKIV